MCYKIIKFWAATKLHDLANSREVMTSAECLSQNFSQVKKQIKHIHSEIAELRDKRIKPLPITVILCNFQVRFREYDGICFLRQEVF